MQLTGIHHLTAITANVAANKRFYTGLLGLRVVKKTVNQDDTSAGGAAAELYVAVQPELGAARQGAGATHHVAFRTPDIQSSRDWAARLSQFCIPNSGEVERYYFRSLYFREPAGNLFEIATDGPGFTVDEPLESLGENLSLPPFLEGRRNAIEAHLKPLD